jgi:hypothetical protein
MYSFHDCIPPRGLDDSGNHVTESIDLAIQQHFFNIILLILKRRGLDPRLCTYRYGATKKELRIRTWISHNLSAFPQWMQC